MTTLVLGVDGTAVIDTTLAAQISSGGADFGGYIFIIVGSDPNSFARKGIIKFDLASVPSDIEVISATLSLYSASETSTDSYTFSVHRSLTEWFEGIRSNSVPAPGVDTSTWNHFNANGLIPWTSGAGGHAGTEYATTPTDSVLVTGINSYFDWDVTADVVNFLNGTHPNRGWWIIGQEVANSAKQFYSSEFNTGVRPTLTIEYVTLPSQGETAGTSTATASLMGRVLGSGEADGSSTMFARLIPEGSRGGLAEGAATATATMRAVGRIAGGSVSAGSAIATATISAEGNVASGSAAGVATATAHLMSRKLASGSSAGAATAVGTITMVGHMRGNIAGAATVTARGWAKATGVLAAVLCNNTPLLFITDGTIKGNGQLNMLNLLDTKNGFILNEWTPSVAQYKGGGYFSESALGHGRRLVRRVFENGMEIMSLKLKSYDQNRVIAFTREYFSWQENAADYWTGDWTLLPVYLVARSARETQTRYATIHTMSIPELANPYAQPFFNRGHPAIETLTLRIERDHWADSPPGEFQEVAVGSIRSWTVAGWASGA